MCPIHQMEYTYPSKVTQFTYNSNLAKSPAICGAEELLNK